MPTPPSRPPTPGLPATLAALAVLACLLAGPRGAAAQEELPAVPVDSLGLGGPQVSPGGAFLRAVLLPGWGHASIGSYNRGAVYFAAEAATAFGLVKTRLRLSEARDRLSFQEEFRRETLLEQGTDPEEVEALLEDDEGLEELRGLVEAREQQQEDWAALGIFLLLLSGADAFVSAHLKDFPAPLELEASSAGEGTLELSVRVPLPGG